MLPLLALGNGAGNSSSGGGGSSSSSSVRDMIGRNSLYLYMQI